MKLLFNRWFLAAMVMPLLLLKFFWVEMTERAGETVHGPSVLEDGDAGVSDKDLASMTGYKLVPVRNNADQVRAQRVHVVGRNGQARTLAFTLASTAPDNDYPSLRITLSQRDGSQPRIVEFAPSGYSHGKLLSSERVELTLDVRDGESRAVIEPFYGPGGA